LDAMENFKSPKYDDSHKLRLGCSLLTERDDENSIPQDMAFRQVIRATPTVYDMLYGDALLNGLLDMHWGLKWIHLPFTIVCYPLLQNTRGG
jgi:hypothetical protein